MSSLQYAMHIHLNNKNQTSSYTNFEKLILVSSTQLLRAMKVNGFYDGFGWFCPGCKARFCNRWSPKCNTMF